MTDGTYKNELAMQAGLALARREHEKGISPLTHLRERRERVKEALKEYAKQQAKQQAKKMAARLAAQAGRALARVLLQVLLTVVRSVIIFLVATPPGWVVDILIVAVIISIIVVANPGGALNFITAVWCKGLLDATGVIDMPDTNPVCYWDDAWGVMKKAGGALGTRGW